MLITVRGLLKRFAMAGETWNSDYVGLTASMLTPHLQRVDLNMIITVKIMLQGLHNVLHLGRPICAANVVVYMSVKEVDALVCCPVLRLFAV